MKEDSKLGLAAAVFWPPGVWPVDLRQSYPMLSFIDFLGCPEFVGFPSRLVF